MLSSMVNHSAAAQLLSLKQESLEDACRAPKFAVNSTRTMAQVLVARQGFPYIITSYDYDAPLDEYGTLNQPKWGHLKQLHGILKSLEKVLTYSTVRNVENAGNTTTVTIFTLDRKSSCFIGNNDGKDQDATINFQNNTYTIPTWSVSILPGLLVCFYIHFEL